MTKKILKIIKSKLSRVIPKKKTIVKKLMAEINSTKKYWLSILAEQFLHLAFKKIKDKIGILSNHLICFLHVKQYDRPDILKFLGNLFIQTLLKLPHILPNINAVI